MVAVIKKYGKDIENWDRDIREEIIKIAEEEILKIEELKNFSVVPKDKKDLNSLYYEIEKIEFKFLAVKIE